jgi:MFS family permease
MVDLAPQAAVQAEAAARPSVRRYYVLGLLTVIYALNFLDRTIFNVLIEPIKKEFALSDTTMGLLAGFGFVLFYSLLGIPIARLADRFNRRNIVAVALAFWSAMTVFCGMAQSVTTLALARIGVGIGESGGTPASQSIIADLFSKTNARARSASTPSALILAYSSVISSAAISTSTTAGGWRSTSPACPASRSPRCCG